MTDKPEVKMHTTDESLIRFAAGDPDQGMVELTPDLMAKIASSLEAARKKRAESYPKLVKECPYETRLAVTAWVMENIVQHAMEGGTFRYLIYDRLGFNTDAYVPLYEVGGMIISNEFDLTK